MSSYREGPISYSSGYGAAGPVAVVAARPEGYGDFGFGEGGSAAAAVAGQPNIWTGVAVGVGVWLLTKFLDRIFFHPAPARARARVPARRR